MEINLARTIESKYTAFNNKFLVLVVFPIGKRKASVCTEVCTWMTIAELLVQAKNASKFLFYWEAERWGKHGCSHTSNKKNLNQLKNHNFSWHHQNNQMWTHPSQVRHIGRQTCLWQTKEGELVIQATQMRSFRVSFSMNSSDAYKKYWWQDRIEWPCPLHTAFGVNRQEETGNTMAKS